MENFKMENREAYDYLLKVYKKSKDDDDKALTTALLALQKQVPREPEGRAVARRLQRYDDGGIQYFCPGCKTYVGWYSNHCKCLEESFDFCPKCGQKINWKKIKIEEAQE